MASTTNRRGGRKSVKQARGRAIPEPIQEALRRRLDLHLRSKWPQARIDLAIHFRGRFAYVGYVERAGKEADPKAGATPFPLFRLVYQGSPSSWLFSLFTYSNERYEPCLGASGDFAASPEESLDCAARLYLA
jgi:hypothetical protein